jgi:hypothetical protein
MRTATVPPRRGTRAPRSTGSVWPGLVWAGFVIVAMLLLGTIELTTWAAPLAP